MVVKNQTSVYDTHYHFVFVTKYRKEIFTTDDKRKHMISMMKDTAQTHDFDIEQIEVVDDYVHLMGSFKPKYSITEIVKKLKGSSARKWFVDYPETKQELWGGHLWAPSYFVGTLGNVSKEYVKEYIKNQLTEYNNGRPRRDSSHD